MELTGLKIVPGFGQRDQNVLAGYANQVGGRTWVLLQQSLERLGLYW